MARCCVGRLHFAFEMAEPSWILRSTVLTMCLTLIKVLSEAVRMCVAEAARVFS